MKICVAIGRNREERQKSIQFEACLEKFIIYYLYVKFLINELVVKETVLFFFVVVLVVNVTKSGINRV